MSSSIKQPKSVTCQTISNARRQHGVVLLAVLVLLLIISLLITGANMLLESRINSAVLAKQKVQDKANSLAQISRIQYLLATQRLTIAGISQGNATDAYTRNEDGQFINQVVGDELRVDGFVYKGGINGMRFQVISHAGIIGVNVSDQLWIKQWMQNVSIDELTIAKLLDSLHDYADENSLQKPMGHDQLGNGQIRNYLIQSCNELRLIKHWDRFLQRHPTFLSHCSLSRSSRLNINQIPFSLWQRLWPNSADGIMQRRQSNIWFSRVNEAFLVEPALVNIPEDYLTTLGSRQFTINVYPSVDNKLITNQDIEQDEIDVDQTHTIHLMPTVKATFKLGTGVQRPITITL